MVWSKSKTSFGKVEMGNKYGSLYFVYTCLNYVEL